MPPVGIRGIGLAAHTDVSIDFREWFVSHAPLYADLSGPEGETVEGAGGG